jgi:hypothetical protein
MLVLMAGLTGSSAMGAIINLGGLLTNASFENGPAVCPTGWTCSSPSGILPTAFTLNNTHFTPGADGLPGNLIVPDGVRALSIPGGVEGSGTISQTGLGNYVIGDTYILNLWVGTPLKVPADGAQGAGQVGTIRAEFTGNGGGQLQFTDITPAAVGQWKVVQLSYVATTTQTIGFRLFVESQLQSGGSGNNRIAVFDVAQVPEPGTFALAGLGMLALGLVRRARRS